MRSRVLDYVDFEKANALLEGFNKSTGFVTAILDLEGNVLSQSGWRSICVDFHRIHPESSKNCVVSDVVLSNSMHSNGKYHFYKCMNGLIDVRVPIMIRGEHVANLFSGQFFFEKPSMDFFIKQSSKYGYDNKAYLEALAEVPIHNKEKVEVVMDFLLNITQLIIEMTAERMDQIELNEVIRKSESDLLSSQNKLKLNMDDLLESQKIAHLGTWHLDLSTNQVVWTEELYNMYGFDPTIPPPPYTEHMKLFTPDSWDRLSNALNHTRTTGVSYELELETITKYGTNGWMWVRGEAHKDETGKIISLWGAAQDITERKKAEERLFYLSYHDHLSGLYNRRFFEEELVRIDIEENLPISIIMCDVNGLKLVNDSFGHSAGDELLVMAAKTIKDACRDNDIVSRVGGDEFIVILTKANKDEALVISNRIKELASTVKVASIELSISYGYDTKTSIEQPIVEIIANAENYMYRHKLYERSSLRSKNIDLIMSALFAKSKREAIHSNRVGKICMAIGTKMNLGKASVNKLGTAGLIHDIGKIGIDEAILNKPGSLEEDERRAVERHPEVGWRLLSSTDEFSELAQFVLSHHEKWDGSGYPNGLIGELIPIEARIIAIADAFDAMTRARSYREEMNIEDVINELKRCSGTQFDPRIVDIFLNQVLTVDNDF